MSVLASRRIPRFLKSAGACVHERAAITFSRRNSSDNFFSLVGRAWGGRLEPSVEVSNQWRPVIRVTSVVEYLVRRKNP